MLVQMWTQAALELVLVGCKGKREIACKTMHSFDTCFNWGKNDGILNRHGFNRHLRVI